MRKMLSKILILFLLIGVFFAPMMQTFAQTPPGGPVGTTTLKFNSTDQGGYDMTTTYGAGTADAAAAAQYDGFKCDIDPRTWGGCLANLVYEIIWTPIAFILTKAGELLDFFIDYSISSAAYTNGFVDKAWGAVRDISNVFFILALLYIALKTILEANVSSQKRLIANVIIFALLINFSLFVTKVVIDTSNVLTKVFYAQITPIDKNGNAIGVDEKKPKSVSVGLIKNVMDPEEMVPRIEGNVGSFFIVMSITIVMMLYIIFMFVTMALLFVARVASLWIAMIFSPLAFMSYALPFNIPGFGHAKWWDLLLKNAFLAPIFVFFLYIVILFGSFLKTVGYNNPTDDWGYRIMGAIIPLLIIFVLLKKAKDLAVEYSGELGAGITAGAKILGGVAIGAATGGLAFAGTRAVGMAGTVGKGAEWADKKFTGGRLGVEKLRASLNTENLKRVGTEDKGLKGFLARTTLSASEKAKTSTFDLRQTKFGTLLSQKTGMDFQSPAIVGLGSKEGGLKGAQKREAEKIEKEKELYKTTMSDAEVRAWSKKRMDDYEDGRKYADDKDAYDKEYIRNNGAIPKYYSNAQDLNKERMEGFRDGMPTRTMLGALAYEAVKASKGLVTKDNYSDTSDYWEIHKDRAEKKARENEGDKFNKSEFERLYAEKNERYYKADYDASIVTEVNNDRINKAKMMVGGALAVATGGVIPMAIPALASYGAVEGANSLAGVESGAQKIVAKGINREVGQVTKISERISDATDRLTKQKTVYDEQRAKATKFYNNPTYQNIIEVEEVLNENGINEAKKDDAGNINVNKINTDALTKAISEKESVEINLKSELQAIQTKLQNIGNSKKETEQTPRLQQRLSDINLEMTQNKVAMVELSEIKGLKDKLDSTREKMASTEQELGVLTGKKDDIGKS